MKKILKLILKYPIIALNRICIWGYFTIKKIQPNYQEIPLQGNKNILVLSPHVDDETIGLGGTLIKYLDMGAKMNLVYLTDGSGSTSHKSKEELIEERMEEGHRIKDSYGFEKVYFLGVPDGRLNSMDQNLVDKLTSILEKESPDIIFSPFPLDGNTDHVETTKALRKTLEIWDEDFQEIYLYQVNTLIEPELVNSVGLLDKKAYNEKLDKFNIFKSQWAMGFSIFHLLDRGRALMYIGSYGVEAFVKVSFHLLEEIIVGLEDSHFEPGLFRQISSEFTLLPSLVKSRREKRMYNKLVKDIMANRELGGSSFRAH